MSEQIKKVERLMNSSVRSSPNQTTVAHLGISIHAEEIVDFLKQQMLLKDVCQKIIFQKIIAQVAREKAIVVTLEEIQAEANNLLEKEGFYKNTNTIACLKEQMMTVEDWKAGICDRLLAQKLANYLFAKKVDKFFAQNRSVFDQFILYQIIVSNELLAREIFYQIEEEEISFYEAAHLYDISEQRRYQCGYEGKQSIGSLPLELVKVVFRAPVGKLLGPVKTEQGYHLLRIDKFIVDELNPRSRQEILELLFEEWLATELHYRLRNQLLLGKHEL